MKPRLLVIYEHWLILTHFLRVADVATTRIGTPSAP